MSPPAGQRRSRLGWPSRRLGVALAAGAFLLALVGSLLLANFQSSARIRQQLLLQHRQAFQLHAVALSHFLATAQADLRYLADSSEVAAFYESRDLGMSMQYGLGLSLIPIRLRLQALVRGPQGAASSRFEGVTLLDADGTLLSRAGDVGEAPPLATPGGGDGAARLDLDGPGRRLVLTHAHWFKGRYAGRVVAWLRPEAVAGALAGDRLLQQDVSRLEVLDAGGRRYRPSEAAAPAPDGLEALPTDGRFQERAGRPALMLARLPVPGQQVTLVDIDRTGDLLGEEHTGAVAMTLAAVLVLAAVAAAVFLDTKSMALTIRLDESQRREAEVAEKHAVLERVERERRRLWQAVNQSPAMVIITDRQGRIEFVNPTFVNVTGYDLLETTGQSFRMLSAGLDGERLVREAFATLQGGGTWHGEVCNRKKSGQLFWMSVSISPARDETGLITHYIALGEDVTARRLVAEELERARDAAEAASKAKSAFLANMSHEIRTPLNAILGYSQVVSRDADLSQGSRHNLEIINRSGEHLLALLNDVLEISKIEAGRSVLEPAAFDLTALLRDVQGMFALRAGSKGLSFEVQAAPDLPACLVGDEGKIRQVLVNLLGNAVKFTHQGGIVLSVSARRGEGLLLHVEVADTGVGIAPEEVGRLFREFEQTASGRQAGSGTGLGLAISRAYARLMGGDVSVTSELGRGSLFVFEFPAAGAASTEVVRPAPARPLAIRGDAPPPHILLVDDQESNRGWLHQALQAVGFEVREAVDGFGAVASCRDGWPDLVLLDLRMPGMDGIEATRIIRSMKGGPGRVPIVALTASGVGEEREAMLHAGADAMLSKPVREQELLETIRVRLGLEYLYASAGAAALGSGAAPLTAGAAASLPQALRAALRDATRRGDLDRLEQLLEEATTAAPALATGLRALASRYDFETLDRALG